MISDRTRQEVWNELLDIDRMCRYYEEVHSKAARWHLIVRLAVLVAVAGGIGAILGLIPGPTAVYQVILATAIAILTVWEVVSNYAKRAATAHAIHVHSSILRVQLRELWLSVDDDSAEETNVRQRVRELAYMSGEVENWAGASDITLDEKLNERTSKDAYTVVRNRYYPEDGEGAAATSSAKPTATK